MCSSATNSISLDAAEETSSIVSEHESKANNKKKSTSNRKLRNTRPDSRRKAKQELTTQYMRAKKLKLAESALKLQDLQLADIMQGNEIFLFTNEPKGINFARARGYLNLKQ